MMLGVVDRSADAAGEEVPPSALTATAHRSLGILDRAPQTRQHVLGKGVLEPGGQSPVFCHG
jgi:hypothetical protein